MCGIAGILDWPGAPEARLGPMLGCIQHRGPDDEGRFLEGPLAMGMRRLSIIDLGGGRQPISNEDGSVVVVFNGEIYNYIELRQDLIKRGHRFSTNSDTEVLVHLYEEEGAGFLQKLNGMFGFALWDRKRRRLFLVRDRLGIKPLYYARTPGGLLFASEMKSILASGLLDTSLDPGAIFDYLAQYYIPGEQSPFREIRKLLPGHYLVAENNTFAITQWWDLADYTGPAARSRTEAREHLRDLFHDSIKLRMRSDVPVGAFLSGGLDSSLITAAAVRQTEIPFSTFSVKFAHTEFDEMPYARAVAKRAGSQHHELEVTPEDALDMLPRLVWHMDEPNGDSAMLPTYLVSEFAARRVKVALSGVGADEFFGGYHRYHPVIGKFERLAILPRPVLRLLRPLFSSLKHEWGDKMTRMIAPPPPWREFLDKTHRFDEPLLRKMLDNADAKLGAPMQAIFDRYPRQDYVNQRMFADAHSYLPGQLLHLTDRMSMAPSLEARAPFLDYRLMEFATSMPGAWKVQGQDWKIILKESLGDLVPKEILKRPKWGFASPVENWVTGKHLGAFTRLCEESRLVKAEIIDAKAMREFLADPKTRTYNSHWFWAVCILEIWYRIFCEGDASSPPACGLEEFAMAGGA